MARARFIVGVDADQLGASAVAVLDPVPEPGAKEPGRTYLLGAPPGWQTRVQRETDDGLPYRLELNELVPVERDQEEIELSARDPSLGLSSGEVSNHFRQQAAAVQFLIDQVSPTKPDRVGVVVSDAIAPESADIMFRALRSPRGRVELFPWPVAASWAWIVRHGGRCLQKSTAGKIIAGTLVTIYVGRRRWQAVPVHLVSDSADRAVVPARDRDKDRLCNGTWSELASEPMIDESNWSKLLSVCASAKQGGLVGIVVTGRPSRIPVAASLRDRLVRAMGVDPALTLAESSCRIGLLTLGATWAARAVVNGGVPYYETVPQIEILGSMHSWHDKPPHGLVWLHYWVNALHGIEELVGNRALLPANRLLRHSPDLEGLSIRTGEPVRIDVAFGGTDVRRIVAEVPGSITKAEPVSLHVEYRLGSGRPKLAIRRQQRVSDPIVFDWEKAQEISESRNDLTRFDQRAARLEDERRRQIRRNRGFPV